MVSDIESRIRSLFGFTILVFVGLIFWQSYWHLSKSDELMRMQGNRRMARVERSIPRGMIFDRNGVKLAWSENGIRRYQDPIATAGVLGYMDPRYNRIWVEREWNPELAGLTFHFDSRELTRILNNEKPHGKDLTLTLDFTLQQAATKALENYQGGIAALDPATGEILALATSPTFNSETIGQDFPRLSSPESCGALRNRAIQDLYPPGSTMKVVTAAAALMHNVSPHTLYTCTGKTKYQNITITDYHGERHGTISMEQALAHSCNYYYARTALALGVKKITETAEAFGFNQNWWTMLPDQRMLPLPITQSSLGIAGRFVPGGELAQLGFGQATVTVTPLQMAMVSAAIANDGTLMAPFLVKAVKKGTVTENFFTSKPIGFPLSQKVAHSLSEMMRHVVTEGTGIRANVRGAVICGKTGTAQQHGGPDHAWFIGFGERKRDEKTQRIAFAVLIERGGTGGRVAAPIAAKIIRAWADE